MKRAISGEQNNFWSLLLEVFKFVALVAAGCFALWQYANTTRREFEAPLWEKQIQLYFSASETAAQLAFRPISDSRWVEARDQFWTLYNGSLCLVEDKKVEEAMVRFSKILYDLETVIKIQSRSKDPDQAAEFEKRISENQKKLQSLSLDISYACRDSLSGRLSSPLPTLDRLKRE